MTLFNININYDIKPNKMIEKMRLSSISISKMDITGIRRFQITDEILRLCLYGNTTNDKLTLTGKTLFKKK